MPAFRVSTVRWAVALFCLLLGSLMLIAPHQFGSRTFRALQAILPSWGVAFLVAGLALLCVVAFAPGRRLTIVAHACACAVLLSLAYTFATTASWTGTLNYLVLGLGVLATPWLAPERPGSAEPRRDLFALLMGLAGVLTGVATLAAPAQFSSPVYDTVRAYLPWHGLAFLVGGLALLAAQAAPHPGRRRFALAHLLCGGAYLLFGLSFAIPNRGWSATALYVGLGGAVMALPALSPWLDRLDLTTLRMRFAFGLTLTAAVPLTLALALISAREEASATREALAVQQNLAVALAQDVSDYIALHRAAVAVLAEHPALQSPDAALQHAVLQQFSRSYPEVYVFASFDAEGRPIARSDSVTPFVATGYRFFEEARQTMRPVLDVLISPTLRRPVFTYSAPVRDAAGRFKGIAAASLETQRLVEQLRTVGAGFDGVVYVVDGRGQVVAHQDAGVMAALPSLAGSPPVAALLAGGGAPGALTYSVADGAQFAGYAGVPGLGWGVVVERPRAVALTPMRAGREDVFGLLVLAVLGASLVGTLLARQFTRPLATLGSAATRLAEGDLTAPLPGAQFSELAQLSDSFAAMRDRLAARAAEHERVEHEQRFLSEAGRILAASLDEDATLEAIARLVVPALADWCVVDMVERDGSLRTRALAHADPERVAQGWELVRRYPLDPDAAFGTGKVVRTGEPELATEVPDALLDAVSQDEEHAQIVRGLGFRSSLQVPMKVGSRVLGAIALVSAEAGRYQPADLPLVEELARRAATAVDNARLYTAAQEARVEAEAAVRSRDEFLSVAAHELRTPLTSLLGYSNLLQRWLTPASGLSDRDRRAVRIVGEQAERLAALISSLLDLSRIQLGQLAIEPGRIDLVPLLRQLAGEMELVVERHSLVLALPDAPLPIEGDEVRLRQLFYNLLQNAVKYSPDGGPVVLRAEPRDGQAVVSVADHGVGIPEAALPRLFQRFFRAHSGTAIGGMGIGLYVVSEIAALHGGAVEVASVEGEGSTFTVRLPLAIPQPAPDELSVGAGPGPSA